MSSKTTNADTPTKAKAPKKPPSFTFFLLLLTWIALGGMAGYFYHVSGGMPMQLLKNVAESGNVSIDIAALSERVTTLESQVEVLESSASHTMNDTTQHTENASNIATPQTETSPAVESIVEQHSETPPPTTAPTTQESDLQNALLKARVAELEAALTSAQQNNQQSNKQTHYAALVIAATNLREAITSHHPFEHELSAFRKLTRGDARFFSSIDALATMASTGIPSPESLEIKFENAAEQAVNAFRQSKENPTIFEKLASRFPSVISIRKSASDASTVPSTDAETRIAQAESLMLEGDYRKAIQLLETIENKTITNQFNDWLVIAASYENARYHADKLVDISRALTQISAGDSL